MIFFMILSGTSTVLNNQPFIQMQMHNTTTVPEGVPPSITHQNEWEPKYYDKSRTKKIRRNHL